MDSTKKMVKQAHEYILNDFATIRKNYGNAWEDQERLNDLNNGNQFPNYDSYLKNNNNKNIIPSLSDLSDEMNVIHEFLGYIKMSPDKVTEHEQTYVIDKSKYYEVNIEKHLANPDDYLNKSDGFIKQVCHFWSEKSEKLANFDNLRYGEQLKALRLTTYYILGQPGVGKTALLNYIFSVEAKKLLENKVIWIRVDLNDPADDGLTLDERLCLKFIKIFCRFYLFTETELGNEKDILIKLVDYLTEISVKNKYFSTDSGNIIKYYLDCYIRFIRDVSPQIMCDKKINLKEILSQYDLDEIHFTLLTSSLMTFIQIRYKYGFIIIFDGLDSVTLDKIQYESYCKWLNEFSSVCDNTKHDYYKAVYIISMRDYSFVQFYINILKDSKRNKEEYTILKVQQKNFYNILTNRFDLIINVLSEQGYDVKKNELWNFKNNLIDIVNACLYGLPIADFSEQFVDNPAKRREEYDLISQLCSGNLRAVMRIFRHIIIMLSSIWGQNCFNYLKSSTGYKGCLKHIEGKEWAIYRVLIFGDSGGCAYRCKISYDLGGNAKIKHRNTALLPNIFNYRETDNNPRNLLKIRVIQLLKHYNGKARILKIIDRLQSIYKCDPKILRADIREMIYDGLIIPYNIEQTEIIFREKNNSDYPLMLTKLSEFIISKILKKSIYYEIICDDTPIDSRYASAMQPLNKYDSNIDLGYYLIIKIFSIFYFILYLQKIETIERKIAQENNISYWDNILLDEKLMKILISDVESFIHKYLKTTKFEQEKKIFLHNWDKYYGRGL